jgi:glycosyltransferase involved in cell wall biosynthesis
MIDPFFTVVIPTHNRSNRLKKAIESVLSQTFQSFEISVIDDHSTDNTFSVVKSFKDRRINYMLNIRKQGACGARNVGIFTAKGKWIAFLDDDDEWLPEKLHLQFESIQQFEDSVGMICTDYKIIKGDGFDPISVKYRPSGWISKEILYGYRIGCLSSTCVRTKILRNINGFDEDFKSSQDWDLWYRVAEISQLKNIPKTLVLMHQEDRSDRIGENYIAKLHGHILMRKKYAKIIDKDPRLRHIHESHIFIYSILLGRKKKVIKCLPWVFAGCFLDPINFIRTFYATFSLKKKSFKKGYNFINAMII